MILTLTANPCLDETLSVERFDPCKMNRAKFLRSDFGGKGINVSAALKNLGLDTFCMGFSFSDNNAAFLEAMRKAEIPCEFVTLPGRLRTCIKIFDRSLLHTIEINEYGEAIHSSLGERLLELLRARVGASSVVVLAGSIPVGLGEDFYLRCVNAVREESPSCRIVVDAEKKLLLRALEGRVSILKPNIFEFQDTFGYEIHSSEELDRAAREVLNRYHLEIVCVSLGANGGYITNGRESWKCRAASVTVRSLQGAGDSMVAGMCMAIEEGKTLEEVLHCGVAAAGDSISREGTQLCTREGVQTLLKQEIGLQQLHF